MKTFFKTADATSKRVSDVGLHKKVWVHIKSLPKDKILDKSVLKAFADDKTNLPENQNWFWEGLKTL